MAFESFFGKQVNNTHSEMITPRAEYRNFKALIRNHCTEEWCMLLDHYLITQKYHAQEHIFTEGEKLEHIHIIDHGKVKISSLFGEDRERILRLARDNEILGHRGLGSDFTYSASAVALSEVRLSLIPLDLFNNLLKANSRFCFEFLLFMADELRKSEQHMKDLERMNVNQRIAAALLMNLEAFGYDKKNTGLMGYCLSRRDLSNLAGTTYETIVRVLGALNEQQIIRIEGKKINILDEGRLSGLLNQYNNLST
jgi:CRP/FNR family transcriptional regulator